MKESHNFREWLCWINERNEEINEINMKLERRCHSIVCAHNTTNCIQNSNQSEIKLYKLIVLGHMAQCTHLLIRNYYIVVFFFLIWKCEIINMFIASFKSFIVHLFSLEMYMRSLHEIRNFVMTYILMCFNCHGFDLNRWHTHRPSSIFLWILTLYTFSIHFKIFHIFLFFHSFYFLSTPLQCINHTLVAQIWANEYRCLHRWFLSVLENYLDHEWITVMEILIIMPTVSSALIHFLIRYKA